MNFLWKYHIILFIFISIWKLVKSSYNNTLSSKFIKYISKHLLPFFSVLGLLKCSCINNMLCFLCSIFHTKSMKKESLYLAPYCTLVNQFTFPLKKIKYQKWGRLLCPDDMVSGSVTEESEETSQYRLWDRKSL